MQHTARSISIYMALVIGTAFATAEPIAARFPDLTSLVVLQDVDPAFPSLVITHASHQGGGAVYVGIAFDVPDTNGDPTCAFGLVEGSRHPIATWLDGPYCFGGVPNFNAWGLYGPVKCFGCDWSEGFPSQVVFRSPITAYYVRHRTDMDSEWYYGWVAIQAVVIENLTCDPQCAGLESSFATLNILAAGFETEPGVILPIGAGLCEADLNFDGVLDLADVQKFVEDFVDGYNIADRDADGDFDLADLQAFVGAFVGGCP